jgi:hypothetical protein
VFSFIGFFIPGIETCLSAVTRHPVATMHTAVRTARLKQARYDTAKITRPHIVLFVRTVHCLLLATLRCRMLPNNRRENEYDTIVERAESVSSIIYTRSDTRASAERVGACPLGRLSGEGAHVGDGAKKN